MNGDETLRDALRDDAKGGAPSSDAWDRVQTRAGSIRYRRQLAQRAIGGLTAAVLVAAVLAAAGVFKSDTTVIATPPSGDQIVAVTPGGVVVLSVYDGQVVRTIVGGVDGARATGVAVSPDGQTVYFTRSAVDLPVAGVASEPCARDASPEVMRVPVDGGPIERVDDGRNPSVSPDGRYLVYASPGAEDASSCGPFNGLVVRDLFDGTEHWYAVDPANEGIRPAGWFGSSNLLLAVDPPGATLLTYTRLVISDEGVTEQPVRVPYFSNGATALPDGNVAVTTAINSGSRLEVIDPSTGEVINTLVDAPGLLGGPIVDASGKQFLLSGISQVDRLQGGSLVRFVEGAAALTEVADPVRDAAWLPRQQSTPPPEPTTTTTTIQPVLGPDQMVVARADGQLDVLAADGAVIRHFGSIAEEIPWIAVSPDGTTAYYERDTINNRCDGAGSFDAVRMDFDPPSFNGVNAGSWPAVSPDGTKIAYRTGPCGSDLVVAEFFTGTASEGGLSPTKVDRTVLDVDTLRTYSLADPADGGPLPELVGPVGWDADNRHLMLQVNREPATQWWYVDTESGSDLLSGKVFQTNESDPNEQGPLQLVPLGLTGRWMALFGNQGANGPFRVVEFDLSTETIVRTLVEVPSPVTIAASDASGAHLLLLVSNGGATPDLYRWSEGATSATFVAAGITAADW